MKIRLSNIVTLTLAYAAVAQFAHAEEGTVSLEAHVHGLSELAIAMEGASLEIQFTSPAMNLVGFEHKARSPKDRSAIEDAGSKLDQHETLFLLSGGGCDHVDTSTDLADLIENDERRDDGHKKEHEAHEAHEAHEDHEDHESHGQENNHSDVVATYKYRCDDIAQLSGITVDLFEVFPGIQKMNALWVTPIRQGAVTLTLNHRIIEFR